MVGGLFKKREDRGGQGQNCPFFFLPSPPSTETEEGKEGGCAPGRRAPGHGSGRGVGENGEEAEGVRFPFLP